MKAMSFQVSTVLIIARLKNCEVLHKMLVIKAPADMRERTALKSGVSGQFSREVAYHHGQL